MAEDKGKKVEDAATANAEDDDGEDEIRLRPKKAPVAPLALKPAELLKLAGEALDAVRALLPRLQMFKSLPGPKVELARLGNEAGIIGAALLGKNIYV